MVPKDSEPTPSLDGLRFILLMSVWKPLWGKFRLHSVPKCIYDQLDEGLCGGLPQKQSNTKMCNPLSEVEQADTGGGSCLYLTLFASKCSEPLMQQSASCDQPSMPIARPGLEARA
eukprot:5904482-Amphidinium_carterae.1